MFPRLLEDTHNNSIDTLPQLSRKAVLAGIQELWRSRIAETSIYVRPPQTSVYAESIHNEVEVQAER